MIKFERLYKLFWTKMKKIFIKLALFWVFCSLIFGNISVFAWGSSSRPDQSYCNDAYENNPNCNLSSWVNIVWSWVENIEKEKKFSVYSQDMVAYMMWFVALLWVLYIIYAGFIIVISTWDEGKVKKSKTSITFVLMWIILMFLAYSIITWIIGVVNTGNTSSSGWSSWTPIPFNFEIPSLVPKANAFTMNDNGTYDQYKKEILIISDDLEREYEVKETLSIANLTKLENAVKKAMETFPENNNFLTNKSIANKLLISIDKVKTNLSSDSKINELANRINNFINSVKIPRITSKISATPSSGNAPLSVSLRATETVDPSWVPLPNNNYMWSIKKPDQTYEPIGYWPSIHHIFKDEKSYIVNLDIKSSSRNKYWKTDSLPFSSSTQIDVLSSIGNIHFYINWINVSDLEKLKITPNIWKVGLILDATASIPRGNSKFVKTTWEFWNGNTTSYDYSPRIEKQYYATEWNYRILLKLRTNEGKEIVKELSLEVRDPIASIKTEKQEWFVWEDFKFNVNTAFIQSKLNYDWIIRDLSTDATVYTSNRENISYKFKKTWDYAVVLKSVSPSNAQDTDTIKVKIESREPVWALDISQASPQTPNVFKFDASSSFDPDTYDWSKLQFVWTIDWNRVDLDDSSRNWAMGKYTFTTEWNHRIVLDITNWDSKSTQIKRDLEVKSLLSIKLNFSPKITKVGSTVNIVAEAKEATTFEWSFGDWAKEVTNNWRINHQYKKSWEYDIYLTVRWKRSWDSNSISRKIYVSDWINPTAYIWIDDSWEEVLPTSSACDWEDAYIINRARSFNFKSEDSINADWTNSNLTYSWKYLWKNSSQSQFSYKFDELGCFPISLTVKSQKTWNMDTSTVYVKVENLLPKVSWLTIAATDLNVDPVVVKVTANNPKDEDGAIVSYLWYYYTDSDPEPQDYRITKSPSTTFVIPRITWKYYFALSAEDSNWAKVNTEESSSERYSIQLATDNINTPIIKLSTDKTSIWVWEDINFEVSVNDILGKDISSKVEYKWDFDWDWFYDETGKTPKITHKFNTPWNINFKVKVSYKGISNTKYQLISVKNTLKPDLEYYSIWKKVILFNTTKWLYTKADWDLWNNIISSNKDYFVYNFADSDFPTSVNLKVGDWQVSKAVDFPIRKDLTNYKKIEKSSEKIQVFAYPEISDDTINIKNPWDKLFIYLGESKWNINKYCIDKDLDSDGDLNWTKDDDCDNKWTDSYNNGSPFIINDFSSDIKKRKIKLSIFDWNTQIDSKNIEIDIWFAKTKEIKDIAISWDISEKDRESIEALKDLIKKAPDRDRLQMMQFLNTLQENWFDQREKMKSVIDFESYVDGSDLDQKQKDLFVSILEKIANGWEEVVDQITLAAGVIKSLIPKSNTHYNEIVGTKEKPWKIDEILSHPTNVTLNKELGKTILDWIKDDTNIPDKDKMIIRSQLQVIIYWSQANIPEKELKQDPAYSGTTTSSWVLWFISWFVKVFIIILILIFGWFIVLFVIFKVWNKNENLSFQDYIIDKFSPWKGKTADIPNQFKKQEPIIKNDILGEAEKVQSNSSLNQAPKVNNTVWWININKQEDVFKNIPQNTNTPSDTQAKSSWEWASLPNWLKWSEDNTNLKNDNKEGIFAKKDSNQALEKNSLTEDDSKKNIVNNDNAQLVTSEKDLLSSESIPSSSGLPDWLKWSETNKEEKNEDTKKLEEKKGDNTEKVKNLEKNIESPKDSSGLPDWLKWSSDSWKDIKQESKKDSIDLNIKKEDELISDSWELPDWFKWLNKDDIVSEVKEELNPPKEEIKKQENPQFIKKDKDEKSISKNDDNKKADLNKVSNEPKNIKNDNTQNSQSKDKKEEKPKIQEFQSKQNEKPKVVPKKDETQDDNLPDWLKWFSEDKKQETVSSNVNSSNVSSSNTNSSEKKDNDEFDFGLDFLTKDLSSDNKTKPVNTNIEKDKKVDNNKNNANTSTVVKEDEKDFSKAKKIDAKPPKKEENILKKDDNDLPDWLK